jgi:hypothetical protein
MATTTNYSWSTPDDTALVKDGAAAIRSLGTAIDTTVFNNASAGIAKTIVDAKGDIIAATAADTVSRLAVGANDTVLTADSSTATGLKWAAPASGGMTLLSTTTLSGASTTISSISGAYTHLFGIFYGVTNNTADGTMYMQYNSASLSTITTQYSNSLFYNFESSDYVRFTYDSAALRPTRTDSNNAWSFTIENYANTSFWKPIYLQGGWTRSSGNKGAVHGGGVMQTNSAISSLVFLNDGGTFASGTVLLYGVK